MNYSIIRILSLSFAVTFFYVSGSLFAAHVDNLLPNPPAQCTIDDLPRDQARCTIDDLPRDPVQNQIVEYALTSKPYSPLTQWLIQQYSDIYGNATPLHAATLPEKGYFAAISPDNSKLVVVNRDVVSIYRMFDFSPIATLTGHNDISDVAISPDSSKVFISSRCQIVRHMAELSIWNMADGTLIKRISGLGNSFARDTVVISPDGSKFITLFRHAKIWNMDDYSCVGRLDDDRAAINSTAITPDGLQVVAGLASGTIKIFSMLDCSHIKTLSESYRATISSIEISRDGSRMITAGNNGVVKIWNRADDSVIAELPRIEGIIGIVEFASTDDYIVTGYADGTVKIWNKANGSLLRTLRGEKEAIRSIALTRDCSSFVTHSRKWPSFGITQIWNMADGSLLGTFSNIWSSIINPDGSGLVTCSLDGDVKIWHMPLFQLFEGLKKVSARQILLLEWLHEVQRKGYKANLNPNNIDLKMNPDPTKPDREKQRRLINNYRAQYDALPALIKELVHDFVIL